MKTFEQFLESVPDGVIPHRHHLGEIQSIIEKQEKKINELTQLFGEDRKNYAQIIKTLEYGLKDESKIKEAVAKAIELAAVGMNWRSSDFSSWAKYPRN